MPIIENSSNSKNANHKLFDLYEKILELESEIAALKKQQAPQTIIIEHLYVRKVDIDKLQFKLDEISVDDLSGMLNVGINSDGKLKQKELK